MPWSGLVDGSLWNITVTTRNRVCSIIIEEYQPSVTNKNIRLLHRVKVSGEAIKGRVLSWPKAICRQGDILVSQFVTHNNPYIQFLVVDLMKEQCFTFCDTMRHFRRSYALMGSVECCLSPDHQMMLLRLPRVVARAHSTSLSLLAKTRNPTQPMTIQDNPIDVTDSFRFQDRKLCILLFDPRFAQRLVSLQVSEFCTKCNILSRDQDRDTTILQKSVLLGQLNAFQVSVADALNNVNLEANDGNYSDGSDDSDGPLLVFRTSACKAEFSRNADRVVLCCLLENHMHGGTYVRVFVFESDTFTCIAKYFQSLEEGDPSESLGTFQLAFSPCDTKVHVVMSGSEMGQLLCTVDIPKPLSLRNFCRCTILNSIGDRHDVDSLPIPPSLKKYLLFQCHRFVEDVS